MTTYGYMRVSTEEQNHDLQEDALRKAGCTKIFADTICGASTSRPQLDVLLAEIGPGDALKVWKIDRLGRQATHLYSMVEDLMVRGITFTSLTEGMDTTTKTGWAMFQMMGVFAELERNTIRERTKEGIAVARARSSNPKQWGRRTTMTQEDCTRILRMHTQGDTISTIAAHFPQYSRSSVGRLVKKFKDKKATPPASAASPAPSPTTLL